MLVVNKVLKEPNNAKNGFDRNPVVYCVPL